MIIDRSLTPWVVNSDDPIRTALQKIDANRARIIFCVSERGHLDGVLSDGDFRRWIISNGTTDLQTPALEIANPAVVTVPDGSTADEIEACFEPGRLEHVAVIDARHHLVGVAVARPTALRIGSHTIGAGHPAFLIAEIGINHNGSLDFAKHLVDLAYDAGADCVKFQMRDMNALYRGDTTGEDLGPQYTIDLLTKFALSNDELFSAFDHAHDRGIDVICTPWDRPSVDALTTYGLPALKIASADLTNHELLSHSARTGVPLLISTGMSTEQEIIESAALVRSMGSPFAMLHCQSTYPAPFKDVNLAYLDRLAQIADCPVGYSGHERGWHVPLAAVARGARIIEKHFTVDRSMEGNDHKVSLLPDEFAEMVRRIRELEDAMGSASPREVGPGEMMNRVNLAKSLVATRQIDEGSVIGRSDVDIKSPGRGLQPNALPRLLGRTASRTIEAGDFFYAADLSDVVHRSRDYTFKRSWGIPVRFHDWEALVTDSTPDFLEFHFSYKDLDLDPSEFFDGKERFGFTTHSPDLFAGDFLLNLASDREDHWNRSIEELQRVIDATRNMRQWFTTESDPIVVASLGGFTHDAHVSMSDLPAMYARVNDALQRLNTDGVRLCAQTLPPFPWYMGGQLYCNLFVGAADTAEFAEKYGLRLCFDVSHSKLSANYSGQSFSETTELLAPHTDHLHLVDATGTDGEGVQVGDGEIDWAMLARQLGRLAPSASFIPEIWQGHVNNGQGFWTALDRLEQWF